MEINNFKITHNFNQRIIVILTVNVYQIQSFTMGSYVSTNINQNELLKKSNVKLQAQQVSTFNGNALKWHAWKKKSRAAIGTAGMLRVLDSESYAGRNKIDNETIFHLLQVATADGTAAHLVDKFEDDQDGRSAYQELVKWYEGDELTAETAEDVRDKLAKISLSSKTYASQYINDFLQHTKHLEDLDEAYTVSKTVSIFLKQIVNPDYRSTVEACHINKYDIHTCIEQVRAKERRLGRERGNARRNHITLRRQESKNDRESQEAIALDNHKNEAGFYAIPSEKWQQLSDDDRNFVKAFNGKLRRELTRANGKRAISTRRNSATEDNDNKVESLTKKTRTVTFKEKENEIKENDTTENENANINNKRAVLSFSVRDK